MTYYEQGKYYSETEPNFIRALNGFKGIGTYEWLVEEDRLIWSPELKAIYGIDHSPEAEPGFTELVHAEDRTRVEAETTSFMDYGDTYAHEFRIIRPDGEVRYIHDRGTIERTAEGSPRRLRGLNIDITELRTAQIDADARLFESEERLKLAYEVADIGAWDLNLANGESVWSAALYDLLGLEKGQPASDELFFAHVHPEHQARLRASFKESIEARTSFDEVFRMIRSDGEVRTVAGRGRVVEEKNGKPTRMIGVNYDITNRIQVEEESHLLIQEANHRFKNMLSLVQAIARQTMAAKPEQFLDQFNARIQALSSAQSILVNNRWQGIDVKEVLLSQLAHMDDLLNHRIQLKGPQIMITCDAGQALGMAIHELATNATKYGALSNKEGQIDIEWLLDTDTSGKKLFVVSWVESMGPRVKKPDRLGFGSLVIQRLIQAAMHGSVHLEYAPEGLIWRMQCSDGCLSEHGAVANKSSLL